MKRHFALIATTLSIFSSFLRLSPQAFAATSEPVMVADINPSEGSLDDYFYDFTVFNGELYFTADDGTHGRELWKSDGTAEGTVMVKDINPVEGSEPQYFTVFNGELYFSLAEGDNTHGSELWKSDGTAEGTVMVADISPDGNSWPKGLTVFNGELYFSADDGTHDTWPYERLHIWDIRLRQG